VAPLGQVGPLAIVVTGWPTHDRTLREKKKKQNSLGGRSQAPSAADAALPDAIR